MVRNEFQVKLQKDLTIIQIKTGKAFIFTDKTRNLYEVDKYTYETLLAENITKTYKKCKLVTYNKINEQAKNIADRLECFSKIREFITLKDHKENLKCPLINTVKRELLGKVRKIITEKIIANVRAATNNHQWKNTNDVIKWFCTIQEKYITIVYTI